MKKFFCYGKKDFCENTDLCIECPHFAGTGGEYQEAPMTNADLIRSMSDEELAKLLLDGCCGSKCDDQPQNKWGSVNCFECRMKWLQQPAEIEKNERMRL